VGVTGIGGVPLPKSIPDPHPELNLGKIILKLFNSFN
jgi:hypothetical protein